MRKGFTLIELLAVITLLGLLSLIVVPVVDKLIKQSEENLYKTQVENIEEAARNYYADKIFDLPENVGDYVDRTICDLEKSGLLEMDIKNPKTDELFYKDSYVRITKKNNGYEYKYNETGSSLVCTICVAATEETVTSGNIPTGNYTPGDEYICEVKQDTKYNFFVLSNEGDNINLIMNSNINNEGLAVTGNEDNLGIIGWCDDEERCKDSSGNFTNVNGPIVALEYLHNATSDWTNIEPLDSETQERTRLPRKSELEVLNTDYNEKETTSGMKYVWSGYNPWLYDNLDYYSYNNKSDKITYKEGINGYWTETPAENKELAWNIDYIGFLNVNHIYHHQIDYIDNGVRPVITVSKNLIKN